MLWIPTSALYHRVCSVLAYGCLWELGLLPVLDNLDLDILKILVDLEQRCTTCARTAVPGLR